MTIKDEYSKKEEYFCLPEEDRMNFEMEDKEKQEKAQAVEKVFKKLNEKFKK